MGRLGRRLRELGLSSYAEYCAHLRTSADSEYVALFNALCIHETRFFREPGHFEYLVAALLPRWRRTTPSAARPRPLRIWCAGCSTGEEAYSLAMTVRNAIPDPQEVDVEILATDLSTTALTVARQGTYALSRAGEIPEAYLKKFMLKGRGRWAEWMRVSPEIRAMVKFGRLNLHLTPYPLEADWAAIFCRNVLIYFDAPTRARVAGELLSRLQRDGALFIGHAEGLYGTAVRARPVSSAVYVPLSVGSGSP